jgi:hypothetical protein
MARTNTSARAATHPARDELEVVVGHWPRIATHASILASLGERGTGKPPQRLAADQAEDAPVGPPEHEMPAEEPPSQLVAQSALDGLEPRQQVPDGSVGRTSTPPRSSPLTSRPVTRRAWPSRASRSGATCWNELGPSTWRSARCSPRSWSTTGPTWTTTPGSSCSGTAPRSPGSGSTSPCASPPPPRGVGTRAFRSGPRVPLRGVRVHAEVSRPIRDASPWATGHLAVHARRQHPEAAALQRQPRRGKP